MQLNSIKRGKSSGSAITSVVNKYISAGISAFPSEVVNCAQREPVAQAPHGKKNSRDKEIAPATETP